MAKLPLWICLALIVTVNGDIFKKCQEVKKKGGGCCECYFGSISIGITCKKLPNASYFMDAMSDFRNDDTVKNFELGLFGPSGIHELTDTMFSGLKMKRLYIGNMKIKQYGTTALFDSANSLKSLILDNVGLTAIPREMVSMIENIDETFFIFNNNIPVIKSNAFADVTTRKIELINNNIQKIEDGAFNGCRKMTHIRIINNTIKSLPNNFLPHDSKDTLDSVDLSKNFLESLPDGSLDGFSKLTSLILSSNPITEIKLSYAKPVLENKGSVSCFDCNLKCDKSLCTFIEAVKNHSATFEGECGPKSMYLDEGKYLPFCH